MPLSNFKSQNRIKLAASQKQTLTACLEILKRYRSVLLYEVTGAGKTYVACALAQFLLNTQQIETIIVAPAHLIANWQHVLEQFQLKIPCYSYQAASLNTIPTPTSENVLWILDEAHMIKNPASKRCQNLKRLTARHQVCMLTATPISMGWKDLHALIQLCGFPPAKELITPQWIKAFAAAITPQTYVAPLGIDIPVQVKQIQLTYAFTNNMHHATTLLETMQQIEWYSIDAKAQLSSVTLLSSVLMHRLCSHRTSCLKTLTKLAHYYKACRLNHTQQLLTRQAFYKMMGCDGRQNLLPFADFIYGGIENNDTKEKLENVIEYIQSAVKQLHNICQTEDDKFIQLDKYLQTIPSEQKIVIFSQYADTARYFAQKLYPKYRVALLTADEAELNGIKISPDIMMAMFDPTQNMPTWWKDNKFQSAQILVCSDAFACGHNFQKASVLIHLDKPWNPIILKQRMGRIVRKGQSSENIIIVHMTMHHPPQSLKQYETQLNHRIFQREKLQNEWFHSISAPLHAQAYLLCSSQIIPETWIYTDETWLPVPIQILPPAIQLFKQNAENHSFSCSTTEYSQDSLEFSNEYILHPNKNMEINWFSIEDTDLISAFYPVMFKHRKKIDIFWNTIKHYQHIPNIHYYIEKITLFTFQCSIFPQLLTYLTETVKTLPQSPKSVFKQILNLPLTSSPPPHTPCLILRNLSFQPKIKQVTLSNNGFHISSTNA